MADAKFDLGILVATPGAIEARDKAEDSFGLLLARHSRGDWGDLNDEDKQANEQALKSGARILSAYKLKDGTKVWIITEADRSATTILLPEEY